MLLLTRTGPKHARTLFPAFRFLTSTERTDLNKLKVESTAQQQQRLEPHPYQSTLQPISSLPTTTLRVQTTLQPVQTTPQMLPMQPESQPTFQSFQSLIQQHPMQPRSQTLHYCPSPGVDWSVRVKAVLAREVSRSGWREAGEAGVS